jgi:hypothetical protein
MALPLKYNTASQTIILGPFLDDTDGKTPKTALTISNTDIKLKKHNATSDASKNSGGATHIANGYYYATLDATDTNTIGRLVISVNVAGALPVWHEFIVYPAEPFDYLFAAAGTDYMKVDIAQVDGAALGTHGSGQLPSDIRQIAGTAVSTSSAQLGVNVVQVGGTSQTARDLGAQCDATISSRASATDYTSARAAKLDNLDATVSSRAPSSTALSNSVWTDTKAGYIDVAISSRAPESGGNVAAIKAKTDQLAFTVTNRVDANALQVGDKTGYSLSSTGIDAIWDATGSLGLSFETLLQRAYEMINNKMTVNESTGAVALRNIGDTATIATGSVTSASGSTTRAELSWS